MYKKTLELHNNHGRIFMISPMSVSIYNYIENNSIDAYVFAAEEIR
jgi:hypothetical protein